MDGHGEGVALGQRVGEMLEEGVIRVEREEVEL